jgi:hypothetical protein
LEDNFGFNPDVYQIRGEKGQPNGYVPLNEGGLIDSQYLPSFVKKLSSQVPSSLIGILRL